MLNEQQIMGKEILSRSDHEYIHEVSHKFIAFWQIASTFTAFCTTKEEIFAGMNLRESLILDHFEGYDLRAMVSSKLPKMIPSRKKWPYKTSRKKFLEFIDKLAKE